jgi:hypothetical protein
MLLYTTLILLRSDCKLIIFMTLKYTLTNIDYIHELSLVDDHIVCDTYY